VIGTYRLHVHGVIVILVFECVSINHNIPSMY